MESLAAQQMLYTDDSGAGNCGEQLAVLFLQLRTNVPAATLGKRQHLRPDAL